MNCFFLNISKNIINSKQYVSNVNFFTFNNSFLIMSINTQQIIYHQGVQGEYYVIDGIKYAKNFPVHWALDHKWNEEIGTGPKECNNCCYYGSLNGVFVCYCMNCVMHTYNGELFPKRNEPVYDVTELTGDEALWEVAPYMRGTKLSEIGDQSDLIDLEVCSEYGDNTPRLHEEIIYNDQSEEDYDGSYISEDEDDMETEDEPRISFMTMSRDLNLYQEILDLLRDTA